MIDNSCLELLLDGSNAPLSTLGLYRARLHILNRASFHIAGGPCEILIYPMIGSVILNDSHIKGRWSVTEPQGECFRAILPNESAEVSIRLSGETHSADLLIAVRMINPSVQYQHITSVTLPPIRHGIGYGSFERTVYALGDAKSPFEIYAGETLNNEGSWSSWPSHAGAEAMKYAEENYARWQEMFFCVTNGYGIMKIDGVYHDGTKDQDSIKLIRNGDTFATPLGAHPVVASPGSYLWYAWFFTGDALSKEYKAWATDVGIYVK